MKKLEELATKTIYYDYKKKGKRRMRKFLVVLLLPAFIITSRVVSTEKQLPYSSKEIYYLTESDYGFYYKETLESPMVYGETAVYANEDLVKESGKLTPGTTFKKS